MGGASYAAAAQTQALEIDAPFNHS